MIRSLLVAAMLLAVARIGLAYNQPWVARSQVRARSDRLAPNPDRPGCGSLGDTQLMLRWCLDDAHQKFTDRAGQVGPLHPTDVL